MKHKHETDGFVLKRSFYIANTCISDGPTLYPCMGWTPVSSSTSHNVLGQPRLALEDLVGPYVNMVCFLRTKNAPWLPYILTGPNPVETPFSRCIYSGRAVLRLEDQIRTSNETPLLSVVREPLCR